MSSKFVSKHIVNCSHCGKQVLDHMTECPHCNKQLTPQGYNPTNYSRIKSIRLFVAVILSLIAVIIIILNLR